MWPIVQVGSECGDDDCTFIALDSLAMVRVVQMCNGMESDERGGEGRRSGLQLVSMIPAMGEQDAGS